MWPRDGLRVLTRIVVRLLTPVARNILGCPSALTKLHNRELGNSAQPNLPNLDVQPAKIRLGFISPVL